MQHSHTFGDLPQEVHVVFDHDDGALRGQLREQLARRLAFFLAHAGHRFVEQQQPAVLHQQHADLQPLLLAVEAGTGVACGLWGLVPPAE